MLKNVFAASVAILVISVGLVAAEKKAEVEGHLPGFRQGRG